MKMNCRKWSMIEYEYGRKWMEVGEFFVIVVRFELDEFESGF